MLILQIVKENGVTLICYTTLDSCVLFIEPAGVFISDHITEYKYMQKIRELSCVDFVIEIKTTRVEI